MKKTIAILLALCLCIGLCACGADVKKSAEAQKADELILAIGEVSLEKESAVLAAKAYYDTLTAEQKAQVENIAVLESAVQELDDLKKAGEYKEIYDKALEYEANLQFDEAYAEYKKLPAEYEDVAQRLNKASLYAGLAGTWVCDNCIATSNKGNELGAIFGAITIKFSVWEGGKIGIGYSGSLAQPEYTNRSIIAKAGYQEMQWLIDSGGLSGEVQLTENGNKYIGTHFAVMSGFGALSTSFNITPEGKMIVEYSRENNNDITTVAFTYSKPQ